jgi:hypothetical protein
MQTMDTVLAPLNALHLANCEAAPPALSAA